MEEETLTLKASSQPAMREKRRGEKSRAGFMADPAFSPKLGAIKHGGWGEPPRAGGLGDLMGFCEKESMAEAKQYGSKTEEKSRKHGKQRKDGF